MTDPMVAAAPRVDAAGNERAATAKTPPAYQRVADELRRMIQSGEGGPDRRLPTEAELVRRFALSRQTVRRAFQELGAEGLVHRVPGRGTFAVPRRDGQYLRSFGAVEDLMALSADTTMEVLCPLGPVVDPAASAALDLDSDAPIQQTRIVRYFGPDAFCVTDASFPDDIARGLDRILSADGPGRAATFIGLLDALLDGGIAGAAQDIRAVACPAEVAEVLGGEPGAPVLFITRVYYDREGRYVEHAVSYYSSERYSHHLELRRRRTH